ncbi:hypothetical protein FN846DRAFT_771381 [Sphaerosporella brunnea]|uniref:DUF1765-domain-containing protein n=1 Tax=Sphaerosporella brunnea TaxID=1250544 RepID=A0A5J5FAW4_9PEZI|nr:hypothetical protein FN846DRAFT_771381 [Sphaerosporella brunnea]
MPHPLPPLRTAFPPGPKPRFTTTTSAVLPSPTNASLVSPLSLDAAPSPRGRQPESVVADGVGSGPSTPTITLSKSSENGDNSTYQRFGTEGSISGQGANRVPGDDAKSRSLWSSPRVSRSPSPSSSRDEDESTKASSISSTSPTVSNDPKADATSQDGTAPDTPKLARTNTGGKRPQRLSLFSRKDSSASETPPPVPSLPQSLGKSTSTERVPATASPSVIKKFKEVKDEMWEAFKLLESDYQKFSSKSAPQKANIIRQCLLPFLRKYEGKASTNISPEVLEKRARTLHRWWTGLVAQLRNRNSQAMAGCDRPIYLEAISYIMSRPEWRSAPSTFAPLAQRTPMSAKSVSSASFSSTSSGYSWQKSVQHNIKVLFTRTLFDTLAYVVEKMAMRTAPPALVAFGGKVIAYAFFFCAGVAEMLISLWGLHPATVRRVLPEFGIARSANLRQISEDIVCEFPETLHMLGFTTLFVLTKQLKTPPKIPIGIQVDWYGPWINRWCGRDSELLFVFIKQYHILMFEYLPPITTTAARLCVPGYVPVVAQLLTLVDNAIHRSLLAPETSTSSTTFDDVLNATAALPLPPRGVTRITAENKLVVLTRDMLLGGGLGRSARECYATSFTAMLKAGVKRTRLHDSDACFQLCELVEELFPILAQAEKHGLGEFIDWSFWLDMARTMMQSENNMTELRVISFVYTTWDILVADEACKKAVCVDWLLSEPIWNRFFCHWSPMVRAYYMRLMVWRLGRYDGDATDVDVEIFKTVLLRLRTGYAHHLRLKEDHELRGGKPSSTAPCLPAPGRRLVILRNDTVAAPAGVILDGIIPTSVPFVATPGSLLHASASATSLTDSEDTTTQSTNSDESNASAPPRRWTLRSVFGFKPAVAPEKNESRPTHRGSTQITERQQPKTLTNFKFSLEWMDRPPIARDRVLGLTRLPASAQRYLESLEIEHPTIEDISLSTIASPHWTYVGRALAEWVMVLVEHESFFERRKTEGRETDKDVETPSLGVDSMRKF